MNQLACPFTTHSSETELSRCLEKNVVYNSGNKYMIISSEEEIGNNSRNKHMIISSEEDIENNSGNKHMIISSEEDIGKISGNEHVQQKILVFKIDEGEILVILL